MSKNRLFHGKPKQRLIVSVEDDTVTRVDELIGYMSLPPARHPAQGNRSEFVRLAIEHELALWDDDSLAPWKGLV